MFTHCLGDLGANALQHCKQDHAQLKGPTCQCTLQMSGCTLCLHQHTPTPSHPILWVFRHILQNNSWAFVPIMLPSMLTLGPGTYIAHAYSCRVLITGRTFHNLSQEQERYHWNEARNCLELLWGHYRGEPWDKKGFSCPVVLQLRQTNNVHCNVHSQIA